MTDTPRWRALSIRGVTGGRTPPGDATGATASDGFIAPPLLHLPATRCTARARGRRVIGPGRNQPTRSASDNAPAFRREATPPANGLYRCQGPSGALYQAEPCPGGTKQAAVEGGTLGIVSPPPVPAVQYSPPAPAHKEGAGVGFIAPPPRVGRKRGGLRGPRAAYRKDRRSRPVRRHVIENGTPTGAAPVSHGCDAAPGLRALKTADARVPSHPGDEIGKPSTRQRTTLFSVVRCLVLEFLVDRRRIELPTSALRIQKHCLSNIVTWRLRRIFATILPHSVRKSH